MPPSLPSQSSVGNVVKALEAAGHKVRTVKVFPDGSFEVETAPVAEPAPKTHRLIRGFHDRRL
jgi:hypothetical protein